MFNSYAGLNAARVKFDALQYLKCDWSPSVLCLGIAGMGGIVCFYQTTAGAILLLSAVVVFLGFLREAKGVFDRGDICAAVVIDAQRNLVATFSDLSKGSLPYPVVKVVRAPLGRIIGETPRNGTRLAYIVLYNGFPGRSRWEGFGGYLVNSGTQNKKTINRVVQSISAGDWEMLDRGIACLRKPYRKGLYRDLDFVSARVPPRTEPLQEDSGDETLHVVCTNCQARVRLKNRDSLGCRVACPKCKRPFVASAPQERAASQWEDDDRQVADRPMLKRSPSNSRSPLPRWRRHSAPLTTWGAVSSVGAALLIMGTKAYLKLERMKRQANPAVANAPAKIPNQAANGPVVIPAAPARPVLSRPQPRLRSARERKCPRLNSASESPRTPSQWLRTPIPSCPKRSIPFRTMRRLSRMDLSPSASPIRPEAECAPASLTIQIPSPLSRIPA
jgi:hypothetical protein